MFTEKAGKLCTKPDFRADNVMQVLKLSAENFKFLKLRKSLCIAWQVFVMIQLKHSPFSPGLGSILDRNSSSGLNLCKLWGSPVLCRAISNSLTL